MLRPSKFCAFNDQQETYYIVGQPTVSRLVVSMRRKCREGQIRPGKRCTQGEESVGKVKLDREKGVLREEKALRRSI